MHGRRRVRYCDGVNPLCMAFDVLQADKEAAHELSNTINTAYRTLMSPLHRIEYILHRNGVEIGEADQLDDIELISGIMDIREEIDAVQPGDTQGLLSLRETNNGACMPPDHTAHSFLNSQNLGCHTIAGEFGAKGGLVISQTCGDRTEVLGRDRQRHQTAARRRVVVRLGTVTGKCRQPAFFCFSRSALA